MFSVLKRNENGFDIVELKDESSGTTASVIPSCGAILHAFTVIRDGSSLNVIDSSFEDLKNMEAGGFKGCKLSPFVCRLNKGQYHFGEKDLVTKKFRLGKHAIHGLLYDASFIVTGQGATETGAWVSLSYAYRGEEEGYPFSYDCEITYRLEAGNT